MKRTLVATAAAILAAGGLAACSYNESLGRNQLLLVDSSALAQAGQQAWAQALQSNKRSTNAAANQRVRNVGSRIVQAAGLTDRQWEYAVFEDPQPNAFALPGGKIGVNTGLLTLVRNDDQLAAVIGHEVAHTVANHAAERMSQSSAAQLGLAVAQSALGGGAGSATAQRIGALGSVGAQVGVLLPFSRTHELEADRIGVDYMARAGYRPSEAVALWQMMSQQRSGGSAPQILSTHPSDASRIAALQEYIAQRGYR